MTNPVLTSSETVILKYLKTFFEIVPRLENLLQMIHNLSDSVLPISDFSPDAKPKLSQRMLITDFELFTKHDI